MCLTGVLSDYMFLCSKYGVSYASSKNDIKDALMHTFIFHSISGCIFVVLSAFIWILCVLFVFVVFLCMLHNVAAFWRNK